MFLSRLDNARKELDQEKSPNVRNQVSTINSKNSNIAEGKEDNETHAKRPEAMSSSQHRYLTSNAHSSTPQQQQPSSSSRILHELNEYLFDLFDANCMEDFHKMDQFEKEAIKLFDTKEFIENPNYEFTHQQYQKHQEFLQLFESLVESFLRSFHYTAEQLYEELEIFVNKRNIESEKMKLKEGKAVVSDSKRGEDSEGEEEDFSSKEPSDESSALEIVEVFAYYTSFEKWCEMMKENVKLKRYFRSFEERMKSAANEIKELKESIEEMKLSHK